MAAMIGLLSDTVTRLRAGTSTDAYGNTVPDWDTATSLTLSARVQQSSQGEDILDRDSQQAQFVVFLPAGSDVTGSDRLTWAGRTLELVGPPTPVGGYRAVHHIEARAREVVG
ncbi:MAG: head-tail adaptor protein [Candidatus Nanopelagicales bacterium]